MPPPGTPRRPQGPFGWLFRGPALYLIVLLVLLWAFLSYFGPHTTVQDLSITKYDQSIRDGRVKSAVLYDKDQRIDGELTDGKHYRVSIPSDYADDITKEILDRGDIAYSVKTGGQSAIVQF